MNYFHGKNLKNLDEIDPEMNLSWETDQLYKEYQKIVEYIPKKFWLCTIQIPSFKKVMHKNKYLKYAQLTIDEQREFLNDIIDKNCEGIQHYLEAHKDGRLHTHFTLCETDTNIKTIQECICLKLGIKSPKQQNEIFNYKECIGTLKHWNNYIVKNQNLF